MSEDPMTIARGAKKIHQSLKELLNAREPYDKGVESQRKELRKKYLDLLLLHPYAKESKDAETHLWMQTSYAFISSYKSRISVIDRAIQANARQPGEGPKQQPQKQGAPGPVEYRKYLQRFRQFLAEEEKFWIQLVMCIHRSFDVKEADTALVALGLISETTGTVLVAEPPTFGNGAVFPTVPSSSMAPGTQAERDSRLSIMSKALICLGDIARYRELYNESGGRPRAGHEAGVPARRGKIRKKGTSGIDAVPMARNYDRAQQRYEQARLLVPYEGNASHQLAIVASYLPDALVSLTHYYRALCVKHPYEPAAENMVIHMTKTFQLWNRKKEERERILASGPPIINQVDILKNRVVVLHALWRRNMDKEVKEEERQIYEDFHRLVGERHLISETISNVVVLSQGALWKHRMIRDTNTGSSRHEVVRTPEANTVLEWRILRHLLDVHLALLEVGHHELRELPLMENVNNDLAQRITAAFRRTLPALRIASKWLRGNINYLMQDPEFKAYQQKEKSKGAKISPKTQGKISSRSNHTVRFWNHYSQFMTSLARAFPENDLKPLTHPLEEDIDMRGFLPLKKVMGDRFSEKDLRNPERAHPNEEQLMRISDLLADAKSIVETQDSPITVEDNRFKLREAALDSRTGPVQHAFEEAPPVSEQIQAMMEVIRDTAFDAPSREEDSLTVTTSRTDEDLLKAAFDHVGSMELDEDEDDHEEIVWDPNPEVASPTLSPRAQATPITHARSLPPPAGALANGKALSSPPHKSLSPKQPASMMTPLGSPRTTASVPALTAQDLLHNVMNAGRRPSTSLVPTVDSPRIQPALLFGTELTHKPITHSIWSASHDEQLLKFGGAPNQPGVQTSPRIYSHTLSTSQELNPATIWSSPAVLNSGATHNAQLHNIGGSTHQNSYVSPPLPQNGVGSNNLHHRVPSSSTSLASNLSHYYGNLNLNDPAIHASSPNLHQQVPLQQQSHHIGPQALLFQQYQPAQQPPHVNQTYYDSAAPHPRPQQQQSQSQYLPHHLQQQYVPMQDSAATANQQFSATSTSLWGKIG